ncbi:MAG: glutamate--tRNA ligase, partial [Firmicutes bacterium]|nr:glutamate--tRNA ligase [Bacillota bacterium]
MKARTRFAPSPTGYMHIGNLRTALYEYLIAKSLGGDFILRIEDTDQGRLVEGSVDVIYNTLSKTGLNYDEGPGKEGDCGPYIQSERRGIYMDYAKKLVENGSAYYCFCTRERLDSLKSGGFGKYDGHCASLSAEEVEENLAKGMPFVIRQKMPKEGQTSFDDLVYGHITVDNSELEDQILIKSDGLPTYNFANVVDDHLMNITHIVRGSEYLSSTPKYNLLYNAFGWELPTYVHVPPVMRDERHKLSKRAGDPSFEDLVSQGFLVPALVNYIALLGWAPPGNREIYSLQDLIEDFDMKGLSKSPSVFDIQKLRWMNSEYLKAMSLPDFMEVAKDELSSAIKTPGIDHEKIAALIKTRIETLKDIPALVDFIDELPDYETELYTHKKMKTNP